jgi:hypothetical protein
VTDIDDVLLGQRGLIPAPLEAFEVKDGRAFTTDADLVVPKAIPFNSKL